MFEPPRCVIDVHTDKIRRRKRFLRSVKRALIFVLLFVTVSLISLILLVSCSTDDERDACCEETILTYRYVRQVRDEYPEFVHTMRHFLFNESGEFIQEVSAQKSTPRQLRLSGLPHGRYTVVTVGNATVGVSQLSALAAQTHHLRDFKLAVSRHFDTKSFGNGDQLFWNSRTFTTGRKKQQRYICDLSNIHCHLFVKIRWNKKPPYTGGKYTLQLEGIPTGNTLDPKKIHMQKIILPDVVPGAESTDKRVVHTFPGLDGTFGTHRIGEELFGVVLYGEFITLRYTNDHIPVFRLYHSGKAISKPIDLAKAFASWGWRPDEHPEQIYRIELEMFDDGTVVVNQWAQTSVKDWEDGGTVEVKR